MTVSDYPDCAIYVDTPLDRQELAARLAAALDAPAAGDRTIELPGIAIDVVRNVYAEDPNPVAGDFIFYPTTIEVYSAEPRQVELVARILEWLRADGIPAVPACDYEDELAQ